MGESRITLNVWWPDTAANNYVKAVIGTFMSTFFNSRFPAITLGGAVIQILLFPCAKVLEYALPDWGITVFGTRHSLNPGPWTFKEQMSVTYSSLYLCGTTSPGL